MPFEASDQVLVAPHVHGTPVITVAPYVEAGKPFDVTISFEIVGIQYSHVGAYLEQPGVLKPFPGTSRKSTILPGSGSGVDMGHVPFDKWFGRLAPTVTVKLDQPGRTRLRLVIMHCDKETWQSGALDYNKGLPASLGATMYTKDFDVNVVSTAPDVSVTRLQYPSPPDTVAPGESVPVVVTTRYALPEQMPLHVEIKDAASSKVLASWDSPPLGGKGTFTSTPLVVRPGKNLLEDGVTSAAWNLVVETSAVSPFGRVGLNTSEFEIEVVPPSPPNVQITSAKHIQAPETVAVGEATPVVVSVAYKALKPGSALLLWFKNKDTGEALTQPFATPALPDSGTFTFSPVDLKLKKKGVTHLRAIVDINRVGNSGAARDFRLKAVAPGLPPQMSLTAIEHVALSDAIAVGEATPVTVSTSFRDLLPGTRVTLVIVDRSTTLSVATAQSDPLSGIGTYTFKPLQIKPTRAGTWSLRTEVRLGESTLGFTDFTINVVPRADQP